MASNSKITKAKRGKRDSKKLKSRQNRLGKVIAKKNIEFKEIFGEVLSR